MFYGNIYMQLQHEKVHLLERIANHLILDNRIFRCLQVFPEVFYPCLLPI